MSSPVRTPSRRVGSSGASAASSGLIVNLTRRPVLSTMAISLVVSPPRLRPIACLSADSSGGQPLFCASAVLVDLGKYPVHHNGLRVEVLLDHVCRGDVFLTSAISRMPPPFSAPDRLSGRGCSAACRSTSASSTRLAATILSRMLGISGNGHLFMEQNALHGSQDELPAILDFQARWPWPSAPWALRAAVPWPSEWDRRSRGL